MKPLPDGYKHRYCESCRNRYIQGGRNVLLGAASILGTAVLSVVSAAFSREKKPKE